LKQTTKKPLPLCYVPLDAARDSRNIFLLLSFKKAALALRRARHAPASALIPAA
jgi:hypothetical protein